MKQQAFIVTGMSCAACSARVEKVAKSLPGMRQVQVNLLTRSMQAQYDEMQLKEADIISAIEKAGYGASVSAPAANSAQEDKSIRRRFVLSLLFLLPMMMLHHLVHNHLSLYAQGALLLPILWLNRRFFVSGTQALLHRAPNMDTLIALGATAGILYTIADFTLLHTGTAYLESAAMILTLITLGKWLESRATAHTGDALARMKALLPQVATVLRNGSTVSIAADELTAGDLLIIAPGARIPADATVTEGVSSIDESTLTGESMPVSKQPGAIIYAGTINGNGELLAIALCTRQESKLSEIIELVGEASSTKAPVARLADQISAVFVPIVVGIALLTALLWLLCGAGLPFAMGCAIAVLVVSCPCALGLATPVAIMAGSGKGAENGILFRSGAAMESAHKATAIVLDKTGTLTTGTPIVTDITPSPEVSKPQLLQLASSLEQNHKHPLAEAIRKAASVYTPEQCHHAQYHPGRGITATLHGELCIAGNAELLSEHGVSTPTLETGSITPLYFAAGKRYMGMISVQDPLKPDSKAAVAALKGAGLRVLMMSGDHEASVRAAAEQCGISEYYAAVQPQDKEAMVRRLQGEGYHVAMVGDGINDAPALTRADVGIAIGAGTDVAMESAGIILVRSELMDVVSALKLSRAIVRIIRQNLFWAFFYNALAIPLAAGVFYPLLGWQLSPGIAAATMSLSSLFVVCNALRLRRYPLFHPGTSTMDNTMTIRVEGMMCPHCERHVAQALSALPGISSVQADHKSSRVTITTSAPVDEALIASTIRQAGYDYKGCC